MASRPRGSSLLGHLGKRFQVGARPRYNGPSMEDERADLGERLAQQTHRLRLLVSHLAGRAILARVELEDLVQEVFLRALSAADIPAAEPGDPRLFRLLARIARNTVVDVARAIRSQKRDRSAAPLSRSDWSHAGSGEVASAGPGPATLVAGRETQRKMIAAYRRLPGDYRRVLGLRQFEGCSAAETARRMGRSETAVHSLYRRALSAWGEAFE